MTFRRYTSCASNMHTCVVIDGGRLVGSVYLDSIIEEEIGIVFDGVLRFSTRLKPDGAGKANFSVSLVGLTIPTTVELEVLSTGRRPLSAPIAVDDGLRQEAGYLDRTTVCGTFSLAWAPHHILPVEVVSEAGVVAQGMARRIGVERSGRPTFHFQAILAALPLEATRVQWIVLGRRRSETATKIECSLSGYVDTVVGSELQGWLVDTSAPGERIIVEVRRSGRVVAQTRTGLARPDVARLIRGADMCGFKVTIPEHERLRGADEFYDVVVGGTHTALHGGTGLVVAPAKGRIGRFDEAVGGLITGWAVVGEAGGPARIEVIHRGTVIGRGLANLFRSDLAAAGLGAPGAPPGFCAFKVRLPVRGGAASGEELEVRAEGEVLDNSPGILQPNPNISQFRRRSTTLNSLLLPRLREKIDYRVGSGFLSLVMIGGGEVDSEELSASLSAVAAQWCSHWELVYVYDGSSASAAERVLQQFMRRDRRFRTVQAEALDRGRAGLAAGLAATRFEYAAELRQSDLLEPDAVYRILQGMRETKADALYLARIIRQGVTGMGQAADTM